MTQTIESFVAKLKSQGVQAGQQEADQLRQQAQQEADAIVAQAKQQAEQIVSEANREAENIVARGRTELQLAARDAALKLRESLEKSLQAVLFAEVKQPLQDAELVKELLEEVLQKYAQADIEGVGCVRIGVSPELHHKLADWAIQKLHPAAERHGCSLDLKANLRQAGFEFNVTGATVEVTQDSVVETLKALVGPELRKVFDQAAGSQGE